MKPRVIPIAFLVLLTALLLGKAALPPPSAGAQQEPAQTTGVPKHQEGRVEASPEAPDGEELDALALEGDLVAGPRPLPAPNDPCLPSLYRDWQEAARDSKPLSQEQGFSRFRIVLDRSAFRMTLEGIRKNGEIEALYESPVGLGDLNTPTPEGQFLINHIYPYPDVFYFSESGERIPGLYKGFFAPLLMCDASGDCQRHRDLGMHGFESSAYPDSRAVRHESQGPVSAGCIRIPDPCAFKATLIRMVGVGPLRRNERGSYHWLDRPVEVVISGDYPGTGAGETLVSLFEDGLNHFQSGLKSLLGVFGP